MRKAMLLPVVFGIVCLIPAFQAQMQAPKPDPAIKKQQAFSLQ